MLNASVSDRYMLYAGYPSIENFKLDERYSRSEMADGFAIATVETAHADGVNGNMSGHCC